MATKLFLNNNTSGLLVTNQGSGLSVTPGPSTTTVVVNTTAGGTAITARMGYFIPAPITISGTVNFNAWGYESNAQANCTLGAVVSRYRPSNASTTTIITLIGAVELGTSITPTVAITASGTPTSTQFIAGDILMINFQVRNIGTMGGGRTVNFNWGGLTASANFDTWVQFTENFNTAEKFRPVN